jgi:hypothetical protein
VLESLGEDVSDVFLVLGKMVNNVREETCEYLKAGVDLISNFRRHEGETHV